MDDAAGVRFALVEAELAGVFAAMDAGERRDAVGLCRQGAVRRSLRIGDYDCFLCLSFDYWPPFASSGWADVPVAGRGAAIVDLFSYAADRVSLHRDDAARDAYPGSARGRVPMCRQINSWISGRGDPQDRVH